MLERHPFQIFHDDERMCALVVNFVDGTDVGMIEGRSRFGFPLKTGKHLGIVPHFVRQEFDGNETAEFEVLGLVNDTHPATAEFFDDAVMRDGLPNHWAEILSLVLRQVNEGEEVGCGAKCQLVKKLRGC